MMFPTNRLRATPGSLPVCITDTRFRSCFGLVLWATLPLVMRGRTTVFPHRGLSPHQFTPMSGAHGLEWTRGSHSVCILTITRPAPLMPSVRPIARDNSSHEHDFAHIPLPPQP